MSAHAKNELARLDQSYDAEYSQSVAPLEMIRRRKELRTKVALRIGTMDAASRDQATRDAIKRHPQWNPFPDASTAMMEKMHTEGKFTGDLAKHAKATFENEFTEDYPEYYETVAMKDLQSRGAEMQELINHELVPKDAAARESLIEETRARHPDWYGQSMSPEMAQQELEAMMGEAGDGTFLGALKSVFGLLDILWLFLGASTAFGTAKKYAVPES